MGGCEVELVFRFSVYLRYAFFGVVVVLMVLGFLGNSSFAFSFDLFSIPISYRFFFRFRFSYDTIHTQAFY